MSFDGSDRFLACALRGEQAPLALAASAAAADWGVSGSLCSSPDASCPPVAIIRLLLPPPCCLQVLKGLTERGLSTTGPGTAASPAAPAASAGAGDGCLR